MENNYELKIKDENILAEIEILSIDSNNKNFFIKYKNKDNVEKLNSLEIASENEHDNLNECKIYEPYIGWVSCNVLSSKGEFYIVEYLIRNKNIKKIVHKSLLRKKRLIYTKLNFDDLKEYSIDIKSEKNLINLIDSIKNMVSTIFIFYSNNKLYYITNDNELMIRLLDTATRHYKNVLNNNDTSQDLKLNIYANSIFLEKNVYELIKNKISNYKKYHDIKFDIKNNKEGKIIDFKTSNKELFDEINIELNIIQRYIDINLNENDMFIKSNDPCSLNYFIKNLEIIDYTVFVIDENNISLRLIAKRNIIEIFEDLVNEYKKNLIDIKSIEDRISELNKLNNFI